MPSSCKSLLLPLVFSSAFLTCSAQTPAANASVSAASQPQFEIVSVKASGPRSEGWSIEVGADSLRLTGTTLRRLVEIAYGVDRDQVLGGPSWMDTLRFDVTAKVTAADVPALANMTRGQRKAMLRPVLEEYFALKLESKTSVRPVYELAISKHGMKLKESPPDPSWVSGAAGPIFDRGSLDVGPGHLAGQGESMDALAAFLKSTLQFEVLNKTGLHGYYDFDLRWDDEQPTISAANGTGTGPGAGDEPGALATALEQDLGLSLRIAKDPVDLLVITSARQPDPL